MTVYNKRPAPFVLAQTAHGSMIVNHYDRHPDPNETGWLCVGYQLLQNGCFDPFEIEMAKNMLNLCRALRGDGVVALDCGANVGVHTIEWAKHMYQWGKVYAFEAQEKIYYALAGNIVLNNCLNVTARHVAISNTNGKLDITVPDYTKPASFGSLELLQTSKSEFIGQDLPTQGQKTQVEQITLDSLALPRVDFIKIDIEGMEIMALNGALETIRQHRPMLLIERIKTDNQALISWLEEQGYGFHQIGINLLCAHKDDALYKSIDFDGTHLRITISQ